MTDNGRPMTTLPLDVQCTHRVPSRLESRRRMQTVLAITAGVMIAEAIGGWLAHSLALLADAGDRKSTRLNSSHGYISYAVFCLKKKKNQAPATSHTTATAC